MGKDAISLHLSEPQPSVSFATFHGLSGQGADYSSGAVVYLVLHEMFESLVVDGADEYAVFDGSAVERVDHLLAASALVPSFMQSTGNFTD